jgi:hypothetical protein
MAEQKRHRRHSPGKSHSAARELSPSKERPGQDSAASPSELQSGSPEKRHRRRHGDAQGSQQRPSGEGQLAAGASSPKQGRKAASSDNERPYHSHGLESPPKPHGHSTGDPDAVKGRQRSVDDSAHNASHPRGKGSPNRRAPNETVGSQVPPSPDQLQAPLEEQPWRTDATTHAPHSGSHAKYSDHQAPKESAQPSDDPHQTPGTLACQGKQSEATHGMPRRSKSQDVQQPEHPRGIKANTHISRSVDAAPGARPNASDTNSGTDQLSLHKPSESVEAGVRGKSHQSA